MFLVFNKEKIYAYLVSILTVCLLFFIASTNMPKDVETSANTEKTNSVETKQDTEKTNSVEAKQDTEKTNSVEAKQDKEKTNSAETSINAEECSLVPNDETNSIDTSGNI